VKHKRVMAATIVVMALAGCSSEDVTESLIEQGIEAEGGGNVDLDLDGGAVKIETEEGTVEFEASEDGSFTVTGPEGSVLMESDGDGMTITDGDQTFETGTSAELPEDFPADLPRPEGNLISASRLASGEGVTFILSYEGDAAALGEVYESLTTDLVAAGFRSAFETSDANGMSAQLTDDTTTVTFSGMVDGEQSSWQYIVAPAAP
jgi:hypothetical protein